MNDFTVFLKSLAISLGHTIKYNGDPNDGQAVEHSERKVLVGNSFQDRLAQALNTDHRRDDNHGQRHHNSLVYPGHDGWKCKRHLHVFQLLPVRRTECIRSFENILVNQSNTKIGQPDHRRDGVDNNRDEPGYLADAQQHNDRN